MDSKMFNVGKNNQPIISFIAMFIILAAIAILKFQFHEQWKDEWQAWFLSRDLGLVDLVKFLYYEGHPALWYIFLKPFALIAPDGDFGLKMAHIIPVSLFLVLWFRSNLPIVVQIIIALSYPLFFEYGVVSRGYILTILLGLVLMINMEKRKSWAPFILFFLCQTEIQGVFFGFSFLAMLLYREKLSTNFIRSLIGYTIGFIVFVASVFPRAQGDELQFAYSANAAASDSWLIAFQGTTANAFFMGIIPDTNVFGTSALGAILGLIALLLIGFLYRKSISAVILFFSYWIASFLFHGIIYNGGLRQWSMVFVAWAFSLLLLKNKSRLAENMIIAALCVGPLFYTFLAVKKEIAMPFSNSQQAGQFLAEKVPADVPIIAINKFECTPVVGYSQKPIYSLPDGLPFTYFKWVEKIYLPPQNELDLFAKFKNAGGLVIVTPFNLDKKRYPNLQLWETFDQPNLKGENYRIYTYKRNSN